MHEREEHHHVHIHLHADEMFQQFINSFLHKFDQLTQKVNQMSQATDQLKAAVAAEHTVIASAITYIQGVPAVVAEAVRKALEDAGVDNTATEAAVNEARSSAEQDTADLQAALTQGTPQQP